MAISEIHVNPELDADTGTGTLLDPFGDTEYGIRQSTFDTVNGTRVNIQSGVTETIVSGIQVAMADTSVTPAWVPSHSTGPLVFEGYTATVGDGGFATLVAIGTYLMLNPGTNVHLKHLDLSGGSSGVIRWTQRGSVIRCIVHGGTVRGLYLTSTENLVTGCYIYDVGSVGLEIGGGHALANRIVNCSTGINGGGNLPGMIERNTILCSGSQNGITGLYGNEIQNNAVYSDGGTGTGIRQTSGVCGSVMNNLVEGFSGVGGKGIDLSAVALKSIKRFSGNGVFDCTTPYLNPVAHLMQPSVDNEILTASPFVDAANGDFSTLLVGNVAEGSTPQIIGL